MPTATKPKPTSKTKSQTKTAKKDTQQYTVMMLSTAKIHIPSTVRAVSENLDYFVKSIQSIGLLKPVTVKRSEEGYTLLSGHNRLEAYKRLGKKTIPARVLEYDNQNDLKQQLSIVDENLCHDELTDLEFAESLGRAKELYEALNPNTKHNASKKKSTSSDPKNGSEGRAKPPAFLDHESRQLGRSRSSLGNYIFVYTHLVEEARQCIRSHQVADIVSDLYSLARETTDQLALAQILHDHTEYRLVDARKHLAQQRKDAMQEDETKSPSDQGGKSPEDSTPAEKPADDNASAGDTNARTSSDDDGNGDPANPYKSESPGETTGEETSTQDSGTDSLERSTPQSHDATTTPPPDAALVATQNSETPAGDTSSGEELITVEDVLLALDEQINTYLRAKNLFIVFHIEIGKTSNEIRVLVRERP